ncbi:uncharacterized protein LOC134214859 [Armigeres subalbatus]|uniref:uncharacterized protein LOC134214859 n=1 Tax=Armigeres subalbatus TaxID=124917 RepID=UPI002ED11BD7
MPPKKRNNASKKLKNAAAENKSARDLARDTAAKQNGARKRAKLCNQGYLLEALDEAMSKGNGAGFTNSGLVFVAANTAKSSTEDNEQNSDPLNLSLKAVQVDLEVDKHQYAQKRMIDGKTISGTFCTQKQLYNSHGNHVSPLARSPYSEKSSIDSIVDIVENSQPNTTSLKPGPARKLVTEFTAAANVSNIQTKSSYQQWKRLIPDHPPSCKGNARGNDLNSSSEDGFDDWDVGLNTSPQVLASKVSATDMQPESKSEGSNDRSRIPVPCLSNGHGNASRTRNRAFSIPPTSSDEDSPNVRKLARPGRVAVRCPTIDFGIDASCHELSINEAPSAVRRPQQTTTSLVTKGMLKEQPLIIPQKDPSQADDGDGGSYREKYFNVLEKYKEKAAAYKDLKKKYDQQKLTIAEMKDLVVFANIETKKAQMDPNAKMVFTTVPGIEITAQQIVEIDSVSKTDIMFGQNLALFFYGAKKLQTMSVTGTATNRFKNAKPRPGISPKKLAFIHEKVQQRVASRVGANNLSQITTLAHATRINKGIAEKIANLNKAMKYAVARKVIRDVEQGVNLAADQTSK